MKKLHCRSVSQYLPTEVFHEFDLTKKDEGADSMSHDGSAIAKTRFGSFKPNEQIFFKVISRTLDKNEREYSEECDLEYL